MSECLFCHLPKERIVSETNLTITLRDGFPVSLGHTLIIPKRHVKGFFDITVDERNELFIALEQEKIVLDNEYQPDGYNIGINNGVAAGQSVMHVHLHLIPRYDGDMDDPKGGVRGVIPEKQKY